MVKKFLFLFFAFGFSMANYATHNRAGDITFRHISGLTYEATITIFADATSGVVADRPEISINWGDGSPTDSLTEILPRLQYDPYNSNYVKRIWRAQHTFPGSGATYTLRVEDRNRNANIDNIVNSVNVPFTIETKLSIIPFSNQSNDSPILLNDPLDRACAGKVFVYNCGAFDPDGDSLAYELAESKGLGGATALGYTFPPASNSISVNPITGDLIWNTPTQNGQYNLAILVKEYRRGVLLGSVLRDIQIDVFAGCQNEPPFIVAEDFYCIDAGSNLSIPVLGDDPDPADQVILTTTSELFVGNNSTNPNLNDFGRIDKPATASINWNTDCEDVRLEPYNISIRVAEAVDPASSDQIPLSAYKTIQVRVIAPAPKNVVANTINTSIQLNWDNLDCQNAIGYYIYRRLDSSFFSPDSCVPGVPSTIGYRKIGEISGLNNTSFLDNNDDQGLIPGQVYCYLITKFFPDGAESYASTEVCAKVEKLVPVITNVSINTTSSTNGQLSLEWSPPLTFNSQNFPPPYRYLIYSLNGDVETLIDSTNSLNDTSLIISNLNTEDLDHSYIVRLFSYGNGKSLAGFSVNASSIFLEITATDNLLQLTWDEDVPWKNEKYTIYRKTGNQNFDSLTTTSAQFYNDSTLANGIEYCYYIESSGKYNLNSVKSPLINLSQEVCETPIDNISPCSPSLQLIGNCENDSLLLRWNNPNSVCNEMDILRYRVYKSLTNTETPFLLEEFSSPQDTSTLLLSQEVAGCYFVTALDSANNESPFLAPKCIEFCPFYELPNVFTPNGDGFSDFFVPLEGFRYVDSINLIIYNRWGQTVFETTDPAIRWNGKHKDTEELVSAGVFYYVCQVFQQSVGKVEPRLLKGNITILDPKFIAE